MNDHDDLTSRLGRLGRQPVDPALASAHLTAMASVQPVSRRVPTKLKVAAAFFAGLLLGGTGLASAGALPGGAQDAAHTALSKVGLNVPKGTARYNGPECGTAADGTPFKNHGQYVKAQPEEAREAAAQSRCGKPEKAGRGGGVDTDDAEPRDDAGCRQAGKGRGKGHASDKGKQHASDTAKGKGQGVADDDPAATGKPDCAPAKGRTDGEPGDAKVNPAPAATPGGKGTPATPADPDSEGKGERPQNAPPSSVPARSGAGADGKDRSPDTGTTEAGSTSTTTSTSTTSSTTTTTTA